MQVLYFLPTVGADIRQRPVAGLADPKMVGHAHDELEKCIPLAVLPSTYIVERNDVLSRYDQYVLRGLWIYVAKSDEGIVLEDSVAWYFPARDPTEQAIIHDR